MNLIIDLIIKIFQAVFEREQRRRGSADGKPEDARAKKDRETGYALKNLDDWLESLLGVEPERKPPPKPRKRPSPPKKAKPPKPLPGREDYSFGGTSLDPRGLFDSGQQIGGKVDLKDLAPHGARGKLGLKRLPGKNVLEQMIYAQVILGPCKAKQRTHSRVLDP